MTPNLIKTKNYIMTTNALMATNPFMTILYPIMTKHQSYTFVCTCSNVHKHAYRMSIKKANNTVFLQ